MLIADFDPSQMGGIVWLPCGSTIASKIVHPLHLGLTSDPSKQFYVDLVVVAVDSYTLQLPRYIKCVHSKERQVSIMEFCLYISSRTLVNLDNF